MADGQDAAREKHESNKKGGARQPRGPMLQFADEEDEEAMIEESFSVGVSEIDDEGISQNAGSDVEPNIESSGKQKLADIQRSLRHR